MEGLFVLRYVYSIIAAYSVEVSHLVCLQEREGGSDSLVLGVMSNLIETVSLLLLNSLPIMLISPGCPYQEAKPTDPTQLSTVTNNQSSVLMNDHFTHHTSIAI